MALWADELTLISEVEPQEDKRVNKNGFSLVEKEVKNTVFCNEKQIGHREFFESEQAGMTISLKVEVHMVDYDNQVIAEYMKKRYSIIKTYKINDEIIELTLSDLRQ